MTQFVASDDVSIVMTDSPSGGDVRVISAGLDAFNAAVTGYVDPLPLAVLAKDSNTRQALGGLTGRTSFGLWFVDLLYLPDSLRGAGLGRALLRQAEAEARGRGCVAGFVYTLSFQAPEFYKREGWAEIGRIPCAPAGASRVVLTKALG